MLRREIGTITGLTAQVPCISWNAILGPLNKLTFSLFPSQLVRFHVVPPIRLRILHFGIQSPYSIADNLRSTASLSCSLSRCSSCCCSSLLYLSSLIFFYIVHYAEWVCQLRQCIGLSLLFRVMFARGGCRLAPWP